VSRRPDQRLIQRAKLSAKFEEKTPRAPPQEGGPARHTIASGPAQPASLAHAHSGLICLVRVRPVGATDLVLTGEIAQFADCSICKLLPFINMSSAA